MSAPEEHVRIERHAAGEPGVASAFGEIVLDRPAKRNALSAGMLDALVRAAGELAQDERVRAIVLRGEGKAFCAGFDLSVCVDDPEALAPLLSGLAAAVRALRLCEKPVVVGAHVAAIAGGCALLGAGDVVVADEQAKLGYPVTSIGVSPAVSAPTLRGLMRGGGARTRLLEPTLVTGDEAHRLGMVHRLVHLPEDVVPRAQLIAQQLAGKPPEAMAATKRWLNRIDGFGQPPDDAGLALLDDALAASLGLVGSDEQRVLLAARMKR